MRALRATRAALTWLALTASLLTTALITAVPASAADQTYTATTSVNVRSGADENTTLLAQLKSGDHVLAIGSVTGDWLPIRFANTTAFVWADYLKVDKKPSAVVTTGPAGRKTATTNVNVRATASLDAAITDILAKGTVIKVTGLSSGVFVQVVVDDATGWIHSQFLSSTTDTTPDTVASYTTTAKLALRVTASVTAANQGTIPAKSTVRSTGTHQGSYTQVVRSGKVGWVITGYLKAVSGTPKALVLPLSKGARYAIADGVQLRASADAESAGVATVEAGTALRITGTTKDGFTQVIWNGTTAWVATISLSTKMPTSTPAVGTDLGSDSLNKLEPYGKAAVLEVRANFPQIKTIYGWRSSSAYSDDHPSGRAIDIMLPDYKKNRPLGDEIAQYFIDNGKRLHVTYILWQQRSYTLARGSWKKMEDRGSDTQNHKNHVHVSFEPS